MLINSANLQTLFLGFRANFQNGLGQHEAQWGRIATEVMSTTAAEEYGWLGQVPSLRKWVGDRVIQNLAAHQYTIRNEKFELTIGISRDKIEDDNIGMFAPLYQEMGRSTAAHPDQLCWGLLKDGWNALCYDGQPFFDTDHPVLDADGKEVSVANTDGGSGPGWYLIDDKRALKPIIYQNRRQFDFVMMNDKKNENVFMRDEYVYGVDGRNNVGFGFWQFAWGSKQTLNAANYEVARAALTGMKGDHGRPLGLMPKLLVVPPSLEGAGRRLLQSQLVNGGETNEWAGSAELLVVPWLA